MHILLIILGLLLLVFGGGCTLLVGWLFLDDQQAMMSDAAIILSYWLPFGLAPLAGGFFLFRNGLRTLRRKRAKAVANLTKEEP